MESIMSSPVPLFLEDEVPAQREKRFPSRQRGRVFDLTEAIERMIAAGYHEAVGKGPAAYRRLWPKQVEQPRVYAGRFDHALLVDRAVGLRDLVACGKIISYAPMEECRDLIAAPAVKGKPLVRYILFFQDGAKHLGRCSETCRRRFRKDEAGLVLREGLHLAVQHEAILRHHAVDFAGTQWDRFDAPYLYWFDLPEPRLRAHVMPARLPRWGSASRGARIVPVT